MAQGQPLASLGRLARTPPEQRRSALTGATLVGTFSVFWSAIAFYLAGPPGIWAPPRSACSASPVQGGLRGPAGPRPRG